MFNLSKKDLSDKALENYATAQLPWQLLADRFPAAERLSRILDEANFNLRQDQSSNHQPGSEDAFIPDLLDYDWGKIIHSAEDGRHIGDGAPGGPVELFTEHKRHVAIIGAGAAGLCAGYHLMKQGAQPVFYEMNRSDRKNFVTPFGRGFSWDWGCRSYKKEDSAWERGALSSGQFPRKPHVPDGKITPRNWTEIFERAQPRAITDFGAMRYPKSHAALHAYVDYVFKDMYRYHPSVKSTWLDFRNPGVFSPVQDKDAYATPSSDDVLKYSTVISTAGIHGNNGGHFYRMEAGTKFGEIHPEIKTLSHKIWNLYYGPKGDGPKDNDGVGYLRKIIDLYRSYVEAIGDLGERTRLHEEIGREWKRLNEKFQGATVYEVLRNHGWATETVDGSSGGTSLLQLYGEIGPGTGGSDVFWWTTFMDSLRVTIHHDEVDHQGFVGGTTYMLMPFLTKTTKAADFMLQRAQGLHETNLLACTNGYRIADPVVAIRRPKGITVGVEVVTMDEKGKTTAVMYDACILTASPAAIRARISIAPELISKSAAFALRSLRLTNAGKIAIHFPGRDDKESKYCKPFWKKNLPQADQFNDEIIVTTITDKNIRQIYTFDDSHWGVESGGGTLMLSYTWDMNSDSFAALSEEQLVRTAWAQMKEIYSDPGNSKKLPEDADQYLEWAIANKQYRALTWTSVDGVNGGYRMSSPGLNQPALDGSNSTPPQQALWAACTRSYNEDTKKETGLFLAGEAISWLALSGWIEGSMHTGIASTIGVVKYVNKLTGHQTIPTRFPRDNPEYHSYGFELPEHPYPGKSDD
jgi:hypothetical protein